MKWRKWTKNKLKLLRFVEQHKMFLYFDSNTNEMAMGKFITSLNSKILRYLENGNISNHAMNTNGTVSLQVKLYTKLMLNSIASVNLLQLFISISHQFHRLAVYHLLHFAIKMPFFFEKKTFQFVFSFVRQEYDK